MGPMLDCAASMPAQILDGKSLAAAMRADLQRKVAALVQRRSEEHTSELQSL